MLFNGRVRTLATGPAAAQAARAEKMRKYLARRFQLSVVAHEMGQWCAYPDFREIGQYTGVLRASNFEIFREEQERKKVNIGVTRDLFFGCKK